MQIAILGRETKLAQAELDATCERQSCLSPDASLFTPASPAISIQSLGSVIKIGELLDRFPKTGAMENIHQTIVTCLDKFRGRKVSFGVSVYGSRKFSEKIQRNLALKIKKQLQNELDVPVRYIRPKDGSHLNAAQIIHNDLLGRGGDFLVIESGNEIIVGRTTSVQDVSSYSKRDYERPCRDAKVGMFPPKLAQTLINLGSANASNTIVDPFCGTGVVLQEALLMGRDAYGSDVSIDMVKCSTKNLDWLVREFGTSSKYKLGAQDATKLSLPDYIREYVVVSEGYLGRPLSTEPDEVLLAKLQAEITPIYREFLLSLLSQKRPPKAVVLCVPVWQTKSGQQPLKIIDQITKLGYTMKQFQSVDGRDLVYRRKNQVVGRQILVLTPIEATHVKH